MYYRSLTIKCTYLLSSAVHVYSHTCKITPLVGTCTCTCMFIASIRYICTTNYAVTTYSSVKGGLTEMVTCGYQYT